MKRAVLWLIGAYQRAVSPLHQPCCRYTPTCSRYAYEAVSRHGVIKGGLLSLWRLLRCNPFSRGGYDPVPDEPFKRRTRAINATNENAGENQDENSSK